MEADDSPVRLGRGRRRRCVVQEDEEEDPGLQARAVSSTTPASDAPPQEAQPSTRRLKRLRPVQEPSPPAVSEAQAEKPMARRPQRAAARKAAQQRLVEDEEPRPPPAPSLETETPIAGRPRRAAARRAGQQRWLAEEDNDGLAEEENDEDYEDLQVEQSCMSAGGATQVEASRRCSRRLRGLAAETKEPLQEEEFERPAKVANRKPRPNCRIAESDAECDAPEGQTSRNVSRSDPLESLADSGEESSGDGAEALSRSIQMAARGGVLSTSRRRLAVDLGTDADPEVSLWEEDLKERWLNASEPRPAVAFSMETCLPEVLKKLPPENMLAGCIVFDAMGKVNLPLLLGAHKQLLLASNNAAAPPATAARQVGWLARQAKRLGLIDEFELRNGRLGKRKQGEPSKPRSQATELLIPEQEVRFPARPKKDRGDSQGSEVKAEGERERKGELFSDEEDGEDEVERFLRRKQAVAKLKSRNDGRQAQIKARRSHDVNMQDMKSTLLAPSLSFDFKEEDEEDDDDASGEALEVSIPEEKNEKPRKDSRRQLLKEQLQKKLRMAMAKGLSSEPASVSEAPAGTDLTDRHAETFKEELELEVENEKEEVQRSIEAAEEPEEEEEVINVKRWRRRCVVDDEDEVADASNRGDAKLEKDANVGKQKQAAKQVRLDEMFAKRSSAAKEAPSPVLAGAEEVMADGRHTPNVAPNAMLEAASVAAETVDQRPRPLKRLRLCSLADQEDMQLEDFGEPLEPSEALDEPEDGSEASLEEEEEFRFAGESDEEFESEMEKEKLVKRRRALVKRRRREAAKDLRRLEWEVEDAQDFGNPTELIAHLGTSTMTNQDRERWKNGIIDKGCGQRSADTKKSEAESRKLIWDRGTEDDTHQLYGVRGRRHKPACFLGTVRS